MNEISLKPGDYAEQVLVRIDDAGKATQIRTLMGTGENTQQYFFGDIQVGPATIRFPIEADNRDQAFANFEESAKKAAEEVQQEIQRQQTRAMLSGAIPPQRQTFRPRIIPPNGG